MVDKEHVWIGDTYRYPTPGGEGMTTTMVVRILPPTVQFPNGRVRHESSDIGWGATVEMEAFCECAELIQDP